MITTQKLLHRNKDQIFIKNKFNFPEKAAQISTPEGSFYLNGGYMPSLKLYLKNHFYFDDYRQTFVNRGSMIHPRAWHQLIMVNGFLYALGGLSDEKQVGHVSTGDSDLQCLNTIERYSFDKDQWRELAPMNHRRAQAGVCSFNNRYLCVFGGKNLVKGRHYEFVKEMEMYEFQTNQWKTLPYVPSENLILLQPGAQQVSSTKILIFGGLELHVDDEEQPEVDPEEEKTVLKEDGLRLKVSSHCIEVDVTNGAVEKKDDMPVGQFYFSGTYSFVH